MDKNKLNKVMMNTAINFASLSYCKRNKVGAVLSYKGRIIACGYNGTIKGTNNCCEDKEGNTNEFTLHAEQNLLTFCNRKGLSTKNCILYVTTSPCKTCAKLIASAGIKKVYYKNKYRDEEGIKFLEKLNIKCKELK